MAGGGDGVMRRVSNGAGDLSGTYAPLASRVAYVGTAASPETNANAVRPTTTGPVIWLMDAGVVPVNQLDGDIVWTEDGPNNVTSDGSVVQVIALTQAEYDLLTPAATTLYFITDAA